MVLSEYSYIQQGIVSLFKQPILLKLKVGPLLSCQALILSLLLPLYFSAISFWPSLNFPSEPRNSALFLSIIRYKQIMIEEQANALPSFCFLTDPPKNKSTPFQQNAAPKKLKQTTIWPSQNFLKTPAPQKTTPNLLKPPPTESIPSGLICKLSNGRSFNLKVQLSAPQKKPILKPSKKPSKKQQLGYDQKVKEIVNGNHESLLDKFLSYFKFVQEQKKMQAKKWQTRYVTEERKIRCEEAAKKERDLKWWKSNEKLKVFREEVDAIESQLIFLK